MLLNCVIRQMNNQIVSLSHVVLLAGHSNVALLEVVALVLGSDHHPQPDVELPLLYEQWLLNVLLQNKDIGLDLCLADRLLLGRWHTGAGLCRLWLHRLRLLQLFRASSPRLLASDSDIVRMGKGLELFGLSAARVLHDEPLELVDRVEEVHAAPTIGISGLEQPHIVPIIEGLSH